MKHSMGAKESLSNVGFENIFVFNFAHPPSEQLEKNLSADFRKFYYATFLMNLHHFSYFDPTKKSAFSFYNFRWHSLLTALLEKNLSMRTMYFLVLVFEHCSLK